MKETNSISEWQCESYVGVGMVIFSALFVHSFVCTLDSYGQCHEKTKIKENNVQYDRTLEKKKKNEVHHSEKFKRFILFSENTCHLCLWSLFVWWILFKFCANEVLSY